MTATGALAKELVQPDRDVALDPFLTAKACGAGTIQERQRGVVAFDPFLTEQAKACSSISMKQQHGDDAFDPFLVANANYGSFKPVHKEGTRDFKAARAGMVDGVLRILDSGDPERTTAGWYLLAMLPSVLFAAVELQWLLVRHHSFEACVHMSIILAAGIVSLIITSPRHLQDIRVPPTVLAALVIVAVIAGTATGILGWNLHWRQISWNFTGRPTLPTSAATPALARSDAGTVSFWSSESSQHTMNSTSVDVTRSAGYADGQIYCAAPIMNPTTAGELALVNFWAIGTNCCRPFGSFTCDGSRDADAGYGVVILKSGAQHFSHAVQKAEVAHKLVSAEGALLVRWTSSPNRIKAEMLMHGLVFVAISFLSAFAVFASAGSTAWLVGLGWHASGFLEKATP